MSSENRDILEAVQALAKTDQLSEFKSIVCKASDINTTELTCTATPIDGTAEFFDVRLNANSQKGFVLIPKNNSIIIICQTSETSAFVSMVSEVDQIYLNGENNGGLVNVNDLTTKINQLVTQITSNFSAIAAIYPYTIVPLTPFTPTDYQNLKVKHGG
jgi:hypothetical protein